MTTPSWLTRKITARQLVTVCLGSALLVMGLAAALQRLLNHQKRWAITIRASLRLHPGEVPADIRVDAYLPEIGRSFSPDGKQWVRRRGSDDKQHWYPLSKAGTRYAIEWHQDGSLELNLGFLGRRSPRHCRLTFRHRASQILTTPSFPLEPRFPGSLELLGEAPEASLLDLPKPESEELLPAQITEKSQPTANAVDGGSAP